MNAEGVGDEGRGTRVRLKWADVADLTIVHANHMVIQFRGDHFFLMFGQSQDPMILPDDEEALVELELKGWVGIKPLIRMSVPASDMKRFAAVLAAHVEKTLLFDGSQLALPEAE